MHKHTCVWQQQGCWQQGDECTAHMLEAWPQRDCWQTVVTWRNCNSLVAVSDHVVCPVYALLPVCMCLHTYLSTHAGW